MKKEKKKKKKVCAPWNREQKLNSFIGKWKFQHRLLLKVTSHCFPSSRHDLFEMIIIKIKWIFSVCKICFCIAMWLYSNWIFSSESKNMRWKWRPNHSTQCKTKSRQFITWESMNGHFEATIHSEWCMSINKCVLSWLVHKFDFLFLNGCWHNFCCWWILMPRLLSDSYHDSQ